MMSEKGRFVNLRPTVCIFLSVMLGVLSGVLLIRFGVGVVITEITAGAIIFAVIYFLVVKYCGDFEKITVILCFCAYLVFSCVSVVSAVKSYNAVKDGYYTLVGQVDSIGYSYDYYGDTKVYGVTVKGEVDDNKITANLKITTDKEVIIGTKVKITAFFIKQTGSLDRDALNYFKSGITHTVEDVRFIKVYEHGENGHDFLYSARHKIFNTLKSAMPNSYGTAYALITGESGHINSIHRKAFINAGIVHLFAVSGLHVGFLSIFIFKILTLVHIKRRSSALICVVITFLYVAITGFSPSATRAFIIMAIIQTGNVFGYKTDRLSALGLSGIIVLALNFRDLFSVGFMLSFTVYAGILLLTKPIENGIAKILPTKASKFFAPYFAAFLSSLPILLYFFKATLFISPLLNILVIPVAGFIFAYLFCALSMCIAFKGLYFVLKPLDYVLHKFSEKMGDAYILPFIIEADKSFFALVAFYMAAFIITDKLNITGKIRFYVALTLFAISAVLLFVANLG